MNKYGKHNLKLCTKCRAGFYDCSCLLGKQKKWGFAFAIERIKDDRSEQFKKRFFKRFRRVGIL